MSAIGVGVKYHCGLNGQGYLIAPNGYSKRDASVFAPRFGTGEQGLSDLDLFRSIAQTDMGVGSFQQKFDPAAPKFALVKNMIYNQYDKLLYTTPAPAVAAFTGNSKSAGAKSIIYKGILYFIANTAANGKVFKYNPSTKTQTSVKADFTQSVSDLAVFGNKLWVAAGTAGTWTYDGTTWVNTAGWQPNLLQPYKGLMIISGTGNNAGIIYSSNDTFAAQTTIGWVGDPNMGVSSFRLFNSRVYIGKPDGLFVYDGIQISNILDTSADIDGANFTFMDVYGGILYFNFKNAVWSFNGSTITKVQEFANYETIKHITTQAGRLWVTTAVITTSGDQFVAGTANYYCYDGLGWYLYYSKVVGQDYGGVLFCNDGTYQHLIFANFKLASTYDAGYDIIDKAAEFTAVASQVGYIYTPTFDAGFPNIDKYLDAISPNQDRMVAGDSVEAQFKPATGAGDASSQVATKAAGTVVDDATVGSIAWANVNNVKVQEGTLADAAIFAVPQGALAPTRTPSTDSPTENDAVNPTYAIGEDAVYATLTQVADAPAGAKKQSYGDFGFVIPTGSTINGIEVRIKGKVLNATGGFNVFLRNGGADKDITFNTTNSWYTLGGPTDLWGISWALSNFTNANFTLNLETYNINQFFFDHITVQVFYTPPAITDNSIKIVKGGTIGGTSKADTGTNYPVSLTNAIYGGQTDLWGNTLAPADINGATFGVAFSAKTAATTVHYLKLTNFGFAVPSNATITGIIAVVRRSTTGVDYISLSVYYTLPGDTWFSLGSVTSTSLTRKLLLFLTAFSGIWRRVQLKFVVTRAAASLMGFREYNMAYYLSPDQTWQWQLRLICTGNTETKLQLLDNTQEPMASASLRENIYQARATDAPISFEDIDFTNAAGAVIISGDITVVSTDSFRSAGFIKIDDEIIRYSGKTSTSFTGCTRGSLGTTAATHSDQAVVNSYYRVVIKSIDNENIASDPTVPNQNTTGQESYISLTLQEAPSG